MYCMPTCAACKAAGVCPKGEAPAVFVPPPGFTDLIGFRERKDRPAPAQLRAMLKAMTPYVLLACDHYTSRENTELYSHWAPKNSKAKYFCEQCGEYRMRKPKPRSNPLPTEPMF